MYSFYVAIPYDTIYYRRPYKKWDAVLQKRLVCFVVINPRVSSAMWVDLGFFVS